jgi:hypothetical protein
MAASTSTYRRSDLVTVGYGKTKLKDVQNPSDSINRRVQVVNTETETAQK